MSLFESAQKQLLDAAKYTNLTAAQISKLLNPERFIEVNFQIRMDNGELRTFQGFRSQHSRLLGPAKGGLRFHENVDSEEVKALAMWMTWKCAIAGLPYGGGKGGVIVNPHELSQLEIEKLSRAFAKELNPFIGQDTDIPAPDVNTNGQIMDYMVDEISKANNRDCRSTFTGKTLVNGGSLGRNEATGRGVAFVTKKAIEDMGKDISNTTIAIQGFGNVGYWAAKILEEMGAKIIGVSDSTGTIYSSSNLSVDKILAYKNKFGNLNSSDYNFSADPTHVLTLDADVLIPAALENAIHKDNVKDIKARVIVEGANGPVTPDADKVLKEMGIEVIPDVLANSGGVTVSYFEWVQNRQGYYWSESLINKRLERMILSAYSNIKKIKEKKNITTRQAAYVYALERIRERLY